MISVAYKEDDKENVYNQNNIIKFEEKKYTIRCEEEEEEIMNGIIEYNRITISEYLKKFPKEKIYLKYYFTDDTYEEIVNNLPNDLLFNINGVPSETELIDLMDYVYYAWQKNGENIGRVEFPCAFHFSIINKWVVEKDKIFCEEFNKENRKHIEYRPFFLEFSGYCNHKLIPKLLKMISDPERNYLTGYFIARENDFENVLGEVGDYEVIAEMEGILTASASPIDNIRGKLVIVDDKTSVDPEFADVLNDNIYKCAQKPYTSHNVNQINKRLIGTAIEDNPRYIKVYNVGQAYCAEIRMESGKVIFSDIGLTKNKIELDTKEIKKAKNKIWVINPQMVILSHWDLDHILGVTNASDSIYDAMWIVPDLWGLQSLKGSGKIDNNLISDSAKRLLKYLDWKNSDNLIILGDDLSKRLIYENATKTMSIWSGERRSASGVNDNKERYNITKANNFGLMIFLKNKLSALLAGDCEYSVMADDLLKKEVNYFVVLHHCSKMSKPLITAAKNEKKAILSYGLQNKFHHPNELHMRQLSDMGYEIISTVGKVHIHLNL